ncbi:hypothetical protein T484DRAFT_1918073 [Baffinella frigidus]|nr:hypothetical protein T484DRAFT_1918073 [Cryptophyta sp. CCMP2293]
MQIHHATTAPIDELTSHPAKLIEGAETLMPAPATPQPTAAEMNHLSRSQSSLEGARRRPVRYRRRNAMAEGSADAFDCVIAAMQHTELEPEMYGRIESRMEPGQAPSWASASLGKRRAGSGLSTTSQQHKTATYGNGGSAIEPFSTAQGGLRADEDTHRPREHLPRDLK